MLKVGDEIPEFTMTDFQGETVTKEDVLGSPFVLYFYPKDDTPGCTDEACQFRDAVDDLDDLDILVVGVSPDSPASHLKFIEKHELNFPLLCDEKLDFARACGVVKEGNSIIRSTFLVDEDGVVQWVESPVKVEGHVERILDVLQGD